MGLTVARCPACGADLNLETDRDYFYCPHCGSKVLKQDNKIVIEHVIRKVDEAEIEREKNDAERLKLVRPLMAFMLVFLAFIVLMLLIGRWRP